MIKTLRSLFTAAAVATTVTCVNAQVVTFTGIYRDFGGSEYGYIADETYTFSFTLNPTWQTGSTGGGSTNHIWDEFTEEHDPLFSAVGGSGASGSYIGTRASIEVSMFNGNEQTIFNAGGMFSMEPLGLVTPNGASLVGIEAYVTSGISHTISGEPMDLTGYFASFSGDYSATGRLTLFVEDSGGPMGPEFELTNVNISAIPEPSTYAAILGASALGLTIWLRRKSGKKASSLSSNADV